MTDSKGRVERAIRFVRTSFFAARAWKDLQDLNRQADEWAWGEAMERRWPEDTSKTVKEAFEEERAKLLALPENPFPSAERLEVAVGKTPYVRFDLNDYSVPHELVKRMLVVLADEDLVRILDGNDIVATHRRVWGKGEEIEDPAHLKRLLEEKRQAHEHRGLDRLSHAAPSTRRLLEELAERGGSLSGAVTKLLDILETYGAEDLESATAEALVRGTPHPHAVRQVLERRRQEEGKPAALPLELPPDPRLRELVVRPHSLESYDPPLEDEDDNDPNDDRDDEAPGVVVRA